MSKFGGRGEEVQDVLLRIVGGAGCPFQHGVGGVGGAGNCCVAQRVVGCKRVRGKRIIKFIQTSEG